MKLKDVRVGMKVVPHSKSTGCSFKAFNESQCARRKKDTWLFVIDIEDSGRILLSPEMGVFANSSFFLPMDLKQWCDADDAPDGYYAVAQKNCTECDLRGHFGCIQAICDESKRGDGCAVIFKQKPQSIEAYDSASATVEIATAYAQGTIRQTEPDPVNKYNRSITGLDGVQTIVDVYRVLVAFNITDPELQHSIKKLLNLGKRGKGDYIQDLDEAVLSLKKMKQRKEQE